MNLRVVGAGVGRTGTHSLKIALEQLLGGRCYHMIEVFGRPQDVPLWRSAFTGESTDLEPIFREYVATVDWPSTALWERLAAENPEAKILLSTRTDAATWWKSANSTVFDGFRNARLGTSDEWTEMVRAMFSNTFTPDFLDETAAMAAYDAHNAYVRAHAAPDRLVEWQPGDGWEPLCAALGVDIPGEPFPVTNTTAEFRARAGWD